MPSLTSRPAGIRRRHRDRKSGDMKYVDRIMSPSTPNDLLLALQNPLSPASKDMMNMLIQEIVIADIITRLIEKYILQKHKIRQKEKEAIVRQVRMKEEISNQYFIIHKQELYRISKQHQQMALLSQIELKKKVEFWSIELKRLDNSIARMETKVAAAEKRKDKHTAEWKTDMAARLDEKVDLGKLAFKGKNGTTVPADVVKNTLKNLVETTPAPVDLVNVVSKSHEAAAIAHAVTKAQSKTAIKFMPPPPPPLPGAPTARHFSQMHRVNLEFNFIKSLAAMEKGAEVTAKDMLEIMKDKKNKPALEQLFAVSEAVRDAQENVFTDAMHIGKELRDGLLELDVANEIRKQTENVLEELKDRFSARETAETTPAKGSTR